MLTISGKHEESQEEKGKHYLRHERRYGSFSRSIALPGGVDAGNQRADARRKTVLLHDHDGFAQR